MLAKPHADDQRAESGPRPGDKAPAPDLEPNSDLLKTKTAHERRVFFHFKMQMM